MRCEICDVETYINITRYQHEPYLDGKNHNFVCMLCSSFVQFYYGYDTIYGIATGRIIDQDFVKMLGFSQAEVIHSFDSVKKSIGVFFVDQINMPIVLNTLILSPVHIIDIGDKHFVVDQNSDVLVELDNNFVVC